MDSVALRPRAASTHPRHIRACGVNVTCRADAGRITVAVRDADGRMDWFNSDDLRELADRMDSRS